MFGIGMSEMLLILAVALLVFGPQKLPEVAKSIAKGLRELRRASDDLRASVMIDLDDDRPHTKPPPARLEPPDVQSASNGAAVGTQTGAVQTGQTGNGAPSSSPTVAEPPGPAPHIEGSTLAAAALGSGPSAAPGETREATGPHTSPNDGSSSDFSPSDDSPNDEVWPRPAEGIVGREEPTHPARAEPVVAAKPDVEKPTGRPDEARRG